MYETTIKGFKIRLTNSLRDELLKEWDPKKVEGRILEKGTRCVLCDYSEKHSNRLSCDKCPLIKFEHNRDTSCDAMFRYLLGSRASYDMGARRVIFYHTPKASRKYVQKIRDTILAMKKI